MPGTSSGDETKGEPRRASLPRGRAIVLLLTAAFALRGLLLILVLPIGDPFDEPFHWGYVEFVAENGRIPAESEPSMPLESRRILAALPRSTSFGGPHLWWSAYRAMPRAAQRELRREAFAYRHDERTLYVGSNYETQQPPLFYRLAGLLVAALRTAPTNVCLFAVRALALAAATLAVPLAYRFFRRLFPKPAALAATLAFAAFPGLGPFTGRLTNDALALPIIVALLGLFVDAARGRLRRGGSAALALLLAAGCWTKLYSLLFLPVAPAVALLAPRPRRWPALRRAGAASAVAVLAVLPWAVHQHAATGDWFGLTFTKEATRAGVGLGRELAAIPRVLRPEMFAYGWRTYVYPGTWASVGAPRPVLWLTGIALLAAVAVPQLLPGKRSARRRAGWLAAAAAVAAFGVGQLGYAVSNAAVAAGPVLVGGEGWYFLVLLPAVLAAGAALGKPVPPRLFLLAAALFLAGDWIATLGVLPATYGGWIETSGSLAPFAAYRFVLASPATAFDVFSRVGLLAVPAPLLAALAAAWLAALAAAAALLLRRLRAPSR